MVAMIDDKLARHFRQAKKPALRHYVDRTSGCHQKLGNQGFYAAMMAVLVAEKLENYYPLRYSSMRSLLRNNLSCFYLTESGMGEGYLMYSLLILASCILTLEI